jgi:hypothetical protein
VFINKDLVVVRAGANGDIVHAYGLIRSPSGELATVQRAILRLRDGDNLYIGFDPTQPDDVQVTFGREHDLRPEFVLAAGKVLTGRHTFRQNGDGFMGRAARGIFLHVRDG